MQALLRCLANRNIMYMTLKAALCIAVKKKGKIL